MSLTVEPQLATQTEPRRETPPAPRLPSPQWGRRLGRRGILAVAAAVWLLSGVYIVGPDQQAVETRFGAVVEDRVLPGIHFHWPFPLGRAHKLKVLQLQRGVIGGGAADGALGRVDPFESQFLTGDQNIIHVRSIVQYSVAEPREYLFRLRDVGRAVEAVVEAELGRQIASRAVDDILTTEKIAVQEAVRQRAQDLIDQYRLGVVISSVNIEMITPPPEAGDAFRDVASARADAARVVNEAEGYANDLLPRARGEAQQILEAAEGYKQRKINQALGETDRFLRLAQEYSKHPDVTRRRLYLESMEEILPRWKKTIVDGQENLDLTIIRRNPQPAGETAGDRPSAER